MEHRRVSRAAWVDEATEHVVLLEVRALPDDLAALAACRYDTQGCLDPGDVALAERSEWPPGGA